MDNPLTLEQAFQVAELVRIRKVRDIEEAAKILLSCIWVQNGIVPFVDINRFNAICEREGWK